MRPDGTLAAVICSPPYAETEPVRNQVHSGGWDKSDATLEQHRQQRNEQGRRYSATPGQVGALKSGELMTTGKEDTMVGDCEWLTWANCYEDSWQDLIVPEAFAHP